VPGQAEREHGGTLLRDHIGAETTVLGTYLDVTPGIDPRRDLFRRKAFIKHLGSKDFCLA
jgi:hypothetical protein